MSDAKTPVISEHPMSDSNQEFYRRCEQEEAALEWQREFHAHLLRLRSLHGVELYIEGCECGDGRGVVKGEDT